MLGGATSSGATDPDTVSQGKLVLGLELLWTAAGGLEADLEADSELRSDRMQYCYKTLRQLLSAVVEQHLKTFRDTCASRAHLMMRRDPASPEVAAELDRRLPSQGFEHGKVFLDRPGNLLGSKELEGGVSVCFWLLPTT